MENPNKIEVLVDCLSWARGSYKADSLGYSLHNPCLLRDFSAPGKHKVSEDGYRIFSSFLGGYQAALADVAIKLSGKSNSKLTSESRLRNLFAVYGLRQEEEVTQAISFLKKALKDKDISHSTPLSYFVEQKDTES